MARRKLALAQGTPQRNGFWNVVVPAEEAGFQPVEQIELLLRPERGVVGDVVGDPHELVERQDDAAMAWMDEPRRNWEILVAVALSGPQCGRVVGHGAASSFPQGDIKRNAASIATLASAIRW